MCEQPGPLPGHDDDTDPPHAELIDREPIKPKEFDSKSPDDGKPSVPSTSTTPREAVQAAWDRLPGSILGSIFRDITP